MGNASSQGVEPGKIGNEKYQNKPIILNSNDPGRRARASSQGTFVYMHDYGCVAPGSTASEDMIDKGIEVKD